MQSTFIAIYEAVQLYRGILTFITFDCLTEFWSFQTYSSEAEGNIYGGYPSGQGFYLLHHTSHAEYISIFVDYKRIIKQKS